MDLKDLKLDIAINLAKTAAALAPSKDAHRANILIDITVGIIGLPFAIFVPLPESLALIRFVPFLLWLMLVIWCAKTILVNTKENPA